MFDSFDENSSSRIPREDRNIRLRTGAFGSGLVVIALSLFAGVTPRPPAIRMLGWLGVGAMTAVATAYWTFKKRD
jgi:xanthosine utilization system XapX-like protein